MTKSGEGAVLIVAEHLERLGDRLHKIDTRLDKLETTIARKVDTETSLLSTMAEVIRRLLADERKSK